jgi:hypothetical protein
MRAFLLRCPVATTPAFSLPKFGTDRGFHRPFDGRLLNLENCVAHNGQSTDLRAPISRLNVKVQAAFRTYSVGLQAVKHLTCDRNMIPAPVLRHLHDI